MGQELFIKDRISEIPDTTPDEKVKRFVPENDIT